MNMTSKSGALLAMTLTLALAACGGGGGGSDGPGPTPTPTPAPSSGFSQKATWSVTLPATNVSVCYDFDTRTEVADCSGNAWDLKFKSSGRTASLSTNSGVSGSGQGGAFGGPFEHTWAELLAWQNGTTDPTSGPIPASLYFKDSASGVFTGSNSIQAAAFEYGVGGENDHKLYPNYRVFLITTDNTKASNTGDATSPVFALQVIGYYGGPSGTASGWPSFRWVDRLSGVQKTATVDASANWVYYDLVAGAVSSESGTWHIAFNRYNVKLNGGASGGGKVGGFVGGTPAGFYDGSGKPVASKFTDANNFLSTLADLVSPSLAVPASAAQWVKDGTTSSLSPAYQGTYPAALDYGWFSYYPTASAASAAGLPAVAHLLKANDTRGTLLRSGEGNSYARFRLVEIKYADPNDASSAQTWTFEFEIQPKP
ncbi:hypothetical protein GCM10007860_28940 [Chitiniphilus shinanonensis]|uniref:Heme-binding HmuY-like protein n=1 Tax=Chitiniphilus shinanonensis TaxID=553088 RepID=A0ABQ6BZR7_9NEIS|nr:HmuY family protein [Chitiniphilus shinanonensis]GLS05737.1 hypothetical protein GCM10007860_28940 [Chitiniphilus shinanonensis]